MKNLMKWELRQTFTSKVFWGILAAIVLFNSVLLIITANTQDYTGMDLFLQGCSDLSSALIFFMGVFAGIHVTGAFEERRIQSAVMAGNSRFKIIAVKLFSYSLAVGAICMCSMLSSFAIGSFVEGTVMLTDAFFKEVVLRILVYTFVEVSWVSICFLLSMFIKNIGASIAVNTVSMLILNILAQNFMDREWVMDILEVTPFGQTFILLGDMSTKNLTLAVTVSVVGLAVVLALSYLKFRKEELK